MKRVLPGLLVAGMVSVVIGTSSALAAQNSLLPGGNVGFNAAVASLFGEIPAFTANVETSLTNNADKSHLTVPMRMTKRGEEFRIEVDLIKMKGEGVALKGLANMENIGMARMTSLVLPKEKGMVVLFPELKFAARVSLSEADLPSEGFKVTKRRSGKDTINGQACVRQNVTLTEPDGSKTEATTWEATALNNFPIRMAFKQDAGSMTMTFSQVELRQPGDDLFKIPADYRQFSSVSSLMQEALTRAFNAAPPR